MYLCLDVYHILQGYLTDIGAIVWLPQYQWGNPSEYLWIDPMDPSMNAYLITHLNGE